ncbi:hypothetical protein FNF27_04227 [Cafeteria roenbergensis]|uniref:PH domain-containing protein n=1 Tax=Cafeteria roenbergensis TaxID=33653 RepID=A0A5A8D310_CAFRO|nr:hypothetical protein FNF28_05776 [Cafeteria roenbergensis]KAA0166771.1 hypothetical protein FNF31_01146 [Cafeteria roenbergensis]KAA0174215.1 hypothetical protein FNF27_04227 [Cafeteria roenbergensis]
MGNQASTAGFSSERVVDVASNVMEAFGPLYVQAYAAATVRSLQEAHTRAAEGGQLPDALKLELMAPPIATEPLEKGWMVKLGAIKASWRRRFFVATNEADNFVVYYFERDEHADTPTRKRGAILPCGLRVRALRDEADRKLYGEHALCLDPGDGRRAWHLRCDSEAERSKWRAVLKYASLHAQPPLSADAVEAAAFCDAYERLRRRLGLWGWYRIDRCEPEQLTQLVCQLCRDRILHQALARLDAAGGAASKDGARVRQAALGELDRVVGAVVASAWQACKEAAAGRAESLREAATSNLPGAVKDLATGKEALRERVSRVLASAAAEATGPGLDHVVNAFLRPLYKAHKAVVQLFWAHMNAILDRGLKERELRAFFRNCRWQRGELLPAFRRVRAVTRGELPEDEAEARSLLQDMTTTWAELIELLQGVTLWEVERVFEESLIRQATWGVYCFVDAVETGPEWLDPAAALRQVTRAMAGDAVKRARRDMRDVLRLIYSPAVRRKAMRHPEVRDALAGSAVSAVAFRHRELQPPASEADEAAAALALDAAASAASGAAAAGAGATGTAAAAAAGTSTAASSADGIAPTSVGGSTRKAEKAVFDRTAAAAKATRQQFADAAWALDELIDATVDAVVESSQGLRITDTLGRLGKLPGSLGI